jgi:cell filamentation protein
VTEDPYLDPLSGILRNRLGIRDPERLAAAEAGLTYAALADLGVRTVPGCYDLAHLCTFHREIFGDIYPWAGEIRAVNLAKSQLFCLAQHVDTYAADVFTALGRERCLQGLPRDRFVERATHYLAEINALHPFREGNGRTQRAFLRQLSREAGWPIDWSGLDPDRNIDAAVSSMRGDNRPLHELLDGLIAR